MRYIVMIHSSMTDPHLRQEVVASKHGLGTAAGTYHTTRISGKLTQYNSVTNQSSCGRLVLFLLDR
ncbi:hypothetical protein J6590_061834 [Homalodisca vitripennis]|nr:hypothetical protein J6590_061834 [Homalodisca vitripennis]